MKLWGGYSSKLFDAHFVEGHAGVEQHLAGAVVTADEHFRTVSKYFDDPCFITNVPEKNREDREAKKRKRKYEGLDSDLEEQQVVGVDQYQAIRKRDDDAQTCRAPVEAPCSPLR